MHNKLSLLILSFGFFVATQATAEVCGTAPTCAELGYTQSVAECAGKPMIKCALDTSKVYCGVSSSCADLGYTMSASQCVGRKVSKCPFDSSQVLCDDSSMIGEIRVWTSATIPSGWRICDGSSLSAAAYPELYAVIGNTFGGYSGNFNLPNLKGRVAVGVGSDGNYPSFTYVLGKSGGSNFVRLENHNIPDHKHLTGWGEATGERYGRFGSNNQIGSNKTDYDNYQYYSGYMTSRSYYYNPPTSGNSDSFQYVSESNADNRTSSATVSYHENRMPFLTVNYIIYIGKDVACDSSYQHNCTGTYQSPSSDTCNGLSKYCSCTSPYSWDSASTSCICSSYYKYSCTGSGESKPSSSTCNGKYSYCNCTWSGYFFDYNTGTCTYDQVGNDANDCRTYSDMYDTPNPVFCRTDQGYWPSCSRELNYYTSGICCDERYSVSNCDYY